jgi:hypothetical protein
MTGQLGGRDLARGSEDAEGDRQIEAAGFLRQIGRSEVDRDALAGKFEARVLQRRPHPITRFLDFGIGQPDHGHAWQTTRQMHLDRNFRGGKSIEAATMDNGERHLDRSQSAGDHRRRCAPASAAQAGWSGGFSSRSRRASSAFSFSRGALENLRLDVELLTTDQIELGQSAGEQCTRVFLDVGGRTRGNESAQTSAEIFKEFRVEHGDHRMAQVVTGRFECSTSELHGRCCTKKGHYTRKLRYRSAASIAWRYQ